MKLVYLAAAYGALALSSFTSVQAANLITNGGFEVSDNGFSPTITPVGWTNIGHSDGVISYSAFSTPAYDGSYYYDEGGYGDPGNEPGDGIEQSVATTIGQSYSVTFGLTGENSSGVEIADVSITGAPLTQYTLDTDTSYASFQDPFKTETIGFTATSALTTIAFTTDANSPSFGNNDPLIDGVQLTTATTSVGAVPEIGTWMMMILGFGLIGGMIRRAYRKSEKSLTRRVRSLAIA